MYNISQMAVYGTKDSRVQTEDIVNIHLHCSSSIRLPDKTNDSLELSSCWILILAEPNPGPNISTEYVGLSGSPKQNLHSID